MAVAQGQLLNIWNFWVEILSENMSLFLIYKKKKISKIVCLKENKAKESRAFISA